MKFPIFLLASTLLAQAPVFEAASIKPNHSGQRGGGLRIDPARIKVINSSLGFCVQAGWNVKEFQVVVKSPWMENERFDIDAVAPAPFQKDEYRGMMQALLADRFGLVVHRETQERPGFALVVAKGSPKLPPAVDDLSVMFSRNASGNRTLQAGNVTMSRFAEALSSELRARVVDQTGVEGKFNMSFEWAPDSTGPVVLKSGELAPPSEAPSGPSLFTALREKFGLKLEAKRVPTDVIVIDRAERPTAN